MAERHTFTLLLISTVLLAFSMATNPYTVFYTSDNDEAASYGLWNLHQQFDAFAFKQKTSAPQAPENAAASTSKDEKNTIILGDEPASTWPPEAAVPLVQD